MFLEWNPDWYNISSRDEILPSITLQSFFLVERMLYVFTYII